MLKGDLDEDLERKSHKSATLDKSIEESQSKLRQLKLEIKTETDTLANYRSQINDIVEEVEQLKSAIPKLRESINEWKSKEREAKQRCLEVEVKNQVTIEKRDKEIAELAVKADQAIKQLTRPEQSLSDRNSLILHCKENMTQTSRG